MVGGEPEKPSEALQVLQTLGGGGVLSLLRQPLTRQIVMRPKLSDQRESESWAPATFIARIVEPMLHGT